MHSSKLNMPDCDTLEVEPKTFKVKGQPSIQLSIVIIDNMNEKVQSVQVYTKTNNMVGFISRGQIFDIQEHNSMYGLKYEFLTGLYIKYHPSDGNHNSRTSYFKVEGLM